MKSISLVCTQHEESGFANASALHAILEQIKPEVIFLELPPENFDQFFNEGTKSNLESISVRQYRKNNAVELVPVDLPKPEDSFFNDFQFLEDSVERRNPGSRRAVTWHKNYVIDYGFAYLNSDYCSKMLAEIDADTVTTLHALDDPKLFEILERWDKVNDQREKGMLKNIQKYCNEASFTRGVFLVGAAHRRSIIERVKSPWDEYSAGIQWDFALGAG